ncbi:AMP-binding protein [Austwickia chelonae]|uniref:AMP-binding protein n=1 Tax=Austwickia chelonae TaxID=100225 RepID=UPI00058B99B2|nr:AMP-binding protein [Austwickia chelonae]
MSRDLVLFPVRPGERALEVAGALRAAAEGSGPAVVPFAADGPRPVLPGHDPGELPDDLVVAVGTSGSTGVPKRALLTAAALRASARATEERLDGPGDWLLALPAHHVAGLQVIFRAVCGGGRVTAMSSGSFRVPEFVDAAARVHRAAGSAPSYVSLVPTQVHRLVGCAEGVAALRPFAAVLVGGAAADPALVGRARELGVRVVTTYGSSETCGGCVYDGVPLSCAGVVLESAGSPAGVGRIVLSGPMVAAGYLGDAARSRDVFGASVGGRSFRTDDLGRWEEDPRTGRRVLAVRGRVDDVIVTGGMKVLPSVVEGALAGLVRPGWTVVVVGVPDPHWGQVVAVALAPVPPADPDRASIDFASSASKSDAITPFLEGLPPELSQLRERLRGQVPHYALPRRLAVFPSLPTIGVGKVDRAAVLQRFLSGADTMNSGDRPAVPG